MERVVDLSKALSRGRDLLKKLAAKVGFTFPSEGRASGRISRSKQTRANALLGQDADQLVKSVAEVGVSALPAVPCCEMALAAGISQVSAGRTSRGRSLTVQGCRSSLVPWRSLPVLV